MQSEDNLKRVHEKLQQLLKQYQQLQKENNKLRQELQDCKAGYEKKTKQADELEQKVAILKGIAGQLDETEKKELDKRLNGYIREIDRCIAMLSE